MNNELQNFCRNVLLLREQAGMTQKELAAALHIRPQTLQKLESGILPPGLRVDVIYNLAKIFHLRPAALFAPLVEQK